MLLRRPESFSKNSGGENDTRVYYYRKDSAASKMTAELLPEHAIQDAVYLHITVLLLHLVSRASCS